MCGIAGFINSKLSSEDYIVNNITKMTNKISHRGPDDSGKWCDLDSGIALGHRRLSILDISDAGHQPMLSNEGRYCVVFNGEIYNHLDLREELLANGLSANWSGFSDTETLLACFSMWGIINTLPKLSGMFSFAVWDIKEKKLTLARDPMGEKPLYYGWQNNVLMFASELKALKQHSAFSADIDRNSLLLYLKHNYVPAPYSIYQNIYKLPAGCYISFSLDSTEEKPIAYWSLNETIELGKKDAFTGTMGDAVNKLDTLLSAAVSNQMVSDVPLGALLSGGIDSTAIVALMQAQSEKQIKTFTIGFDDPIYNEGAHANSVAKHLGTDHTELIITAKDAQDVIPKLPMIFDEPFADISQIPTYLVMSLAREHVTVALSGDGGDELFGGYNRYILGPKLWKTIGWMPSMLRSSLGLTLQNIPFDLTAIIGGSLSKHLGFNQSAAKINKLAHRLKYAHTMDDLYLSFVTEWHNAEDVVIDSSLVDYFLGCADMWPKLTSPEERMMAVDSLSYMPDDILVKVDRTSMSTSLEARAPFLNLNLIKFAWSLPLDMKIKSGNGKTILRDLLDRYVPRDMMERPKMGFSVPVDDWLRGPLRSWAEALLDESRLVKDGYFNAQPIREIWLKHITNQGNYGAKIWSVLMFQAWLDEEQKN